MIVIESSNVTDAFLKAVAMLLSKGRLVSPRGLRTLELSPVSFIIDADGCDLVQAKGRSINPAFAVAEMLWILSGNTDQWLVEFNARLVEFMDHGVLRGAYGPRLRNWGGGLDQLSRVVERLRQDPDTRRAVLQIWDPAIDLEDSRDVACTLCIRFLLRHGLLHGFVTMRSQDLWWGFPYDLHFFSMILNLTARWVGVSTGRLHHCVDSLHIYERHWAFAEAISPHTSMVPMFPLTRVPPIDQLSSMVARIRSPLRETVIDEPWRTMQLVLESYRKWKTGDRTAAWELQSKCVDPYRSSLAAFYTSLSLHGGTQ
jgi:thymidylate synthase